jgi:hypothetical protein
MKDRNNELKNKECRIMKGAAVLPQNGVITKDKAALV